jgi:hypothetical protein
LKGKKVLIFSSFKDTARYLYRALTAEPNAAWLIDAGKPNIRRIDSGNHPSERPQILGLFAPVANARPVPESEKEINILISTDVLSEGQNLQDCGIIINYDLTWNPIRLVQRNGRIDRIGSPHPEIAIYNMFPETELEALPRLVERLTTRIATIDDLGLLDASVLGEVVHPRTFNTLRRILEGDNSALDEEEERAELAGPEKLLKDLKDMLNRDGADQMTELPNGIHSGLRREKFHGMFFYFQALRADGIGRRHFWRYIDARTHEVLENRFEIADRIACQPDEPRYIGQLDVFALQDRVIDQILGAELEAEAKAAAPTAVDPIQQAVTEELKNSLRRRSIDREQAKLCIAFLGQPMGRALHVRLREIYGEWAASCDDVGLLSAICVLADRFAKDRYPAASFKRFAREDLDLICYEYLSA